MPTPTRALVLGAALALAALLPTHPLAGPRAPEPTPETAAVTMGEPVRPVTVERCETCHGIDGNSLHFDFPKLAGQRRDYLIKQMRDIKSGKRKVDVMVPVLSLLDDKQMVELADWFSSRPLVKGSSPDPTTVNLGKRIFDLGVPYRMVAQCSACHGTSAEGRMDPGLVQDGFGGFPALNGQHAAYTEKQLLAFRSGARGNDFNSMMHNLARNMSDQEIKLVANYVAGMELPPPAPEVAAVAAVTAPAAAAGCVACHGPSGNSVAPMFPKLAGQQKAYLLKQLTDMKSGARKVPLMAKIIEQMKAEDFEPLASYFSAQTPVTTPGTADDTTKALGMRIFYEGTPAAQACYSCHNFDGRGSEDFGLSPGGYPMLFGQQSAYVSTQLKAFKSGERKNDHIEVMRNISRNLTDAEIDAVSAFLQEMKY